MTTSPGPNFHVKGSGCFHVRQAEAAQSKSRRDSQECVAKASRCDVGRSGRGPAVGAVNGSGQSPSLVLCGHWPLAGGEGSSASPLWQGWVSMALPDFVILETGPPGDAAIVSLIHQRLIN